MSGSAADGRLRVLIVSSGDALARIAAGALLEPGAPWRVVGLLETRFEPIARLRLVKSAASERSLYYALYMQLEMFAARRSLDALGARGRAEWAPALADAVQAQGGRAMLTTQPNAGAALEFARQLAPHLVLSIRPGHILRRAFIRSFPLILNLHLTRLPYFRGIGGVFQSLAAGERELACTFHAIDSEGVDRGGIAAQATVPAVPGESVLLQTLRLYLAARALAPDVVRGVATGSLSMLPNEGGSYFSWPGPGPLGELRKRGGSLWRIGDLARAEVAIRSAVDASLGSDS